MKKKIMEYFVSMHIHFLLVTPKFNTVQFIKRKNNNNIAPKGFYMAV